MARRLSVVVAAAALLSAACGRDCRTPPPPATTVTLPGTPVALTTVMTFFGTLIADPRGPDGELRSQAELDAFVAAWRDPNDPAAAVPSVDFSRSRVFVASGTVSCSEAAWAITNAALGDDQVLRIGLLRTVYEPVSALGPCEPWLPSPKYQVVSVPTVDAPAAFVEATTPLYTRECL